LSERGGPDLELKEMRPGIVGHRVFGAPVDVDAPPTPFALSQKLMGQPTLICVGVGWVKQTPRVCPTCGIAPFSEASDKSGNSMAAVNAPLPRRRRDSALKVMPFDGRSL
jgi:hypothetical protein